MGDPAKKDQRLFGDIIVEREAAMPTRHEPTTTTVTPFRPTPGPSGDAFAHIWALGYHRLCPIIPPGAPISNRSSLSSRLARGDDARGKMPGVKWPDGNWSGFDFVAHESTPSDLPRWQAMGAGVGVKTGRGLALIDADATDPAAAAIIAAAIEEHFGHLPARIGRPPKAGYLIRVEDDFQYARIEFRAAKQSGGRDRVEILYEGRQFVAHGIHPVTNKPYHWPEGMPALADVPSATAAQLLAFLAALRPLLPAAGEVVQEGAASDVPQASLLGDIRFVRDAVALIPNDEGLFEAREDYLKMGFAIRAACGPEYEADGFEIYQEWCDRWKSERNKDNEPEVVAGDWRRMKPPFRIGAAWLYAQAERFGGGVFSAAAASAALWLDPPGTEPLFPEPPKPELVIPAEGISWIDPTAWAGKPVPPREWLLTNILPRREVSAIYGEGGIGKTLLAHQLAVHCAAGLPFLGQDTRHERVMAFFCEDSEDELQRRHADVLRAADLEHQVTRDHLRVTSRRTQDNRLAVWDPRLRTMNVTPLWRDIRQDALRFGAGLLVLDTLADIFGGEENDRAQVTSFVTRCLNRLAAETGATVLVLAHPSTSGASSGSGYSGSTAWNGKFRARLFLKRVRGAGAGSDVRELEGMKANYGPAGGKLKLRWERGAFSLVASSGLGLGASKIVPQLDDAAEQAVVTALQECAGEKLSAARNSAYFAPKVLKARVPENLGDWSQDDVWGALQRLMSRGAVQTAKAGRDASGHSISTLVLVEGAFKSDACGAREGKT